MPASGGRFGPNAPAPAAMTTARAAIRFPAGGFDRESAIAGRGERRNSGAEMECRRKRRGLLDQPIDQLGGIDSRIAGNVVDRLFRIERGALSAGRWQRVEHMAAHVEHAAFEDREKPDRSGADDRDVTALGIVAHVDPPYASACRARAARKQMLRALASGIYNASAMIVTELSDEEATAALAARIAALARPGDVIALDGELGAGKTTFARAFIRARGNAEEVPSPTFTLVQIYDDRRRPDLAFRPYRLRDPDEAWELGIEDAFRDGISLIEWPERLGTLLPARRLSNNPVRLRFTECSPRRSRSRRRLDRTARRPCDGALSDGRGARNRRHGRGATARRCAGFSRPRAGPGSRRSCSPATPRSGATTG